DRRRGAGGGVPEEGVPLKGHDVWVPQISTPSTIPRDVRSIPLRMPASPIDVPVYIGGCPNNPEGTGRDASEVLS
ncbi:hypothetical protein SARC_17848, partial [Sphaeroforma arctica JP610]